MYDDKENTPQLYAGRPIPRHEATNPPPCYKCPKVPQRVRDARQRAGADVTPGDAVDPDALARRVVEHFHECAACGIFPDDPIVRRHAGLIRPAKDAADRRPLELLTLAVLRRT